MGGSRELLTEMKPNGSRNFESPVGDIVGTHTGFYVGLNLHNPRPGYHYEWGNNRASYRLINRQKGFEMIAASDDDAPACFADLQRAVGECKQAVTRANCYRMLFVLGVKWQA